MKKVDAFVIVIVMLGIAIGAFCIYKIGGTFIERKQASNEYEVIMSDYTKGPMIPENEVASNIDPKEEAPETEKDEYTKHGLPLLEIDFKGLASVNSDIVGWLHMGEIGVSHPIVQSNEGDDDRYLNYTFEGKRNGAGCLFIYPEVSSDFSDKNTFIYGHNMKDGTMFGGLKKIYNSGKMDDKYFYIYTKDDMVHVYKVFAALVTKSNSDMYMIPGNNKSYDEYVNKAIELSSYTDRSALGLKSRRNIVTLSTCQGNTGTQYRLLVLGVLEYERSLH